MCRTNTDQGGLEFPVRFLGDHVDTDVIIPARYCNLRSGDELGRHCLEDVAPDVAELGRREGVILAAGENFGCGSSREEAPVALRHAGVRALVCAGFARIFFRNAVNTGLVIAVCPELSRLAPRWAELGVEARGRIDLKAGRFHLRPQGQEELVLPLEPLPPFMLKIFEAGGLVASLTGRNGNGGTSGS